LNIQKYIKINAPKEDILQELRSFDTMSQWWPGIQNLVVIKTKNDISMVDIVFKVLTTFNLTLEFDLSKENIIKFRQLKGWFKAYQGDWTLLQSPDGVGMIIKITLTVECGRFVPKGMVYSQLTQNLTQLGVAFNKRLQSKMHLSTGKVEQPELTDQKQFLHVCRKGASTRTNARKTINIFQTKEGLEIWLSGKRYLMKSTR